MLLLVFLVFGLAPDSLFVVACVFVVLSLFFVCCSSSYVSFVGVVFFFDLVFCCSFCSFASHLPFFCSPLYALGFVALMLVSCLLVACCAVAGHSVFWGGSCFSFCCCLCVCCVVSFFFVCVVLVPMFPLLDSLLFFWCSILLLFLFFFPAFSFFWLSTLCSWFLLL